MAESKANLKEAHAHIQTLYNASIALTQASKGLAKAFGQATGEEVKLVETSRRMTAASREVASFADIFRGSVSRMVPPKVHTDIEGLTQAIKKSSADQRNALKEASKGLAWNEVDAQKKAKKQDADLKFLRDSAAAKMRDNRAELQELKAKDQAWQNIAKVQNSLTGVVAKLRDTLTASPAMFALYELSVKTWKTSVAYAEALQQANSSMGERLRLMTTGLQVQIATGASTQETAAAMTDMVSLGLEHSSTLKDDLKTSVMMSAALGVSSSSAAHLAQASAMTGTSMSKVADSVARVSAMTALSAEEATRLSSELGKAMRVWLPAQKRGGYAGAAGELMMFAGALKEVGGVAEDITKLSTDIISARNMSAAALLGVNMQTMGTAQGAKIMKERLAELSKQLQGNPFLIQAYSKMLGISAETLATASDALAKENKLRAEYGGLMDMNGELQKRYNNQMADTGQAFEMLKNTFNSLLGEALLPLNMVLTGLARMLTSIVQGIGQVTGGAEVLAGLMMVGLVGTLALVAWSIKALCSAFSSLRTYITETIATLITSIQALRSQSGGSTGWKSSWEKAADAADGGGATPVGGWKGMSKSAKGSAIAGGVATVGVVAGSALGGEAGEWMTTISSLIGTFAALIPIVTMLAGWLGITTASVTAFAVAAGAVLLPLWPVIVAVVAALAVLAAAWYFFGDSIKKWAKGLWSDWKMIRGAKDEELKTIREINEAYRGMVARLKMTVNQTAMLGHVVEKLRQSEEGQMAIKMMTKDAMKTYADALEVGALFSMAAGPMGKEATKQLIEPAVAAGVVLTKTSLDPAAERNARAAMEGTKTLIEATKATPLIISNAYNNMTRENKEERKRRGIELKHDSYKATWLEGGWSNAPWWVGGGKHNI